MATNQAATDANCGTIIAGDGFLPQAAQVYSNRQRLFLLYFVGTLIDLVVLGLFDQYSDKVHVESFSIMLLAAVLLQVLLKATLAVEHWVASHFKARQGAWMKFLRFFCAWLVLFGSKFVILEALSMTFGHTVQFEGVLHGIVWLIVTVVTMVIAEELAVRLYRRLA